MQALNTKDSSIIRLMVVIIITTFSLMPMFLLAQTPNEATVWYFGEEAGLDFSTGDPIAITDGVMNSFEGVAIANDELGNLLFYTNGGDNPYTGGVWNRNHQLMPNGDFTGTNGCNSAFQSSIIIKQPGSSSRFYLFTADCLDFGGTGGLRYNIIDMNLDGGLGDVVAKDISLFASPVDESLATIKDATGDGYWIITHELQTSNFHAFHFTKTGITGTVSSNIGPATPYYAGTIKLSANKEKLCYSADTWTGLFDFDASTGTISNYIDLNLPSYSCEFSPNCKLLYLANGVNRGLFQIDLMAEDVPASAIQVGVTSSTGIGNLQLGPNRRIYVARFFSSDYVGVIKQPNFKGMACTYMDNGVYLSGKKCAGGLPNFASDMIGECVAYDWTIQSPPDWMPKLTVDNIGQHNANLSWSNHSNARMYTIYYKAYDGGEWQYATTSYNQIRLDNLDSDKNYKVHVEPLFFNNSDYQPITGHFTNEILGTTSFEPHSEINGAIFKTLTEFEFSLYPNPANQTTFVALKSETDVTVELMDLSGKIIYQQLSNETSIYKQIELPITLLPQGMYQVVVSNAATRSVKPLVIVH